jgi:chromosome transmission fidelity protein 18
MASDMQILAFLKNDYSSVFKTSRMPKQSVVGKKCFPITLADESRLFVSVNETVLTEPRSSACSATHHVLGVSFSSIMENVKLRRRTIERVKLRDEANAPTSAIATENAADNSLLWVDKHAPESFVHLLSNERCNREVIRALREWDPYVFGRAPPKRPDYIQSQMDAAAEQQQQGLKNASNPKDKRPDEASRVILLSGPPGVGYVRGHIAA